MISGKFPQYETGCRKTPPARHVFRIGMYIMATGIGRDRIRSSRSVGISIERFGRERKIGPHERQRQIPESLLVRYFCRNPAVPQQERFERMVVQARCLPGRRRQIRRQVRRDDQTHWRPTGSSQPCGKSECKARTHAIAEQGIRAVKQRCERCVQRRQHLVPSVQRCFAKTCLVPRILNRHHAYPSLCQPGAPGKEIGRASARERETKQACVGIFPARAERKPGT